MKSNNIRIIVDQALHGYQNGHSLLSTSTELAPEIKRTIMVMSDMSGQSMKNGFEEYITGYQLREINTYALAKTWYAPEMNRPGCVWTHTILVKYPDLIHFSNNQSIIKLFHRPDLENDYSYYSQKKEIHFFDDPCSVSDTLNQKTFIEDLIYNLYNESKCAILIPTNSPCKFEPIVLSLWLQQWPKLKRNFSFCTGAISPRSLYGKYLDLQIVPEIKTQPNSDYPSILLNVENPKSRKDHWVKTIYQDLQNPYSLRGFLKNYGIDVKSERTSFKQLVQLFDYLSRDNNLEISDAIKTLADLFPSKDEAISVKSSILNENHLKYPIPRFDEIELLFELSITTHYKAFEYSKLSLTSRILKQFSKNPDSVFDLINRLILFNVNEFGMEMIKQIALNINEDYLEQLNQDYKKLPLIFLRLNRELLYTSNLWKCDHESQKEIFYFLLKLGKCDDINWQKIINNVLDQGIYIQDEIVNNDPQSFIFSILNWLNSDSKRDLDLNIIQNFKNYPGKILKWYSDNTNFNYNTIRLFLKVINPNSLENSKFGTEIYLKLLKNRELILDDKIVLNLNVFALAAAFNLSDRNSFKIIQITFEYVYKALLKDNVEFDLWKYLECHTKSLNWWNDWDKAKKLLNTLFDIFNKSNLKSNEFEKIFHDSDILFDVINRYHRY